MAWTPCFGSETWEGFAMTSLAYLHDCHSRYDERSIVQKKKKLKPEKGLFLRFCNLWSFTFTDRPVFAAMLCTWKLRMQWFFWSIVAFHHYYGSSHPVFWSQVDSKSIVVLQVIKKEHSNKQSRQTKHYLKGPPGRCAAMRPVWMWFPALQTHQWIAFMHAGNGTKLLEKTRTQTSLKK